MKIIFDFDHTLYDMSSMHEAMEEAASTLGIPLDTYKRAYHKVTDWKVFSVENLANFIEKETGVPADKIRKELEKLADMSDLFVYSDSIEGLQTLKEAGHELFLLSWGDSDWQKRKLNGSGLEPYFNELLALPQLKAEAMKSWHEENAQVVFIDDKSAEIKGVQKMYPDDIFIRMKRSNGKYSDQATPEGVYEATNMKEVVDYINSL